MYSYFDESKYKQNIGVREFKPSNLIELFHWKNGMPLKGSGGKEKSLHQKVLKKISIINDYKRLPNVDLRNFNTDFGDISAVWRIFLLHTIKPHVYPIYDQHIHRTYNYIHNIEWRTINSTLSDKKKLDFYFNTYLPYVKSLDVPDLKAMDEAFLLLGSS